MLWEAVAVMVCVVELITVDVTVIVVVMVVVAALVVVVGRVEAVFLKLITSG